MSQLFHRFHWMFVPLFAPSIDRPLAAGATVPERLRALDVYRRLGRVDRVILCTAEEYWTGADDQLREREPPVATIDWTGFDEALAALDGLDALDAVVPRRERTSVTHA